MVHLAADTRVMDSIENPAHNFEYNVIGTFNLLELCRELGVNRVVAASTGGAILGDVEPPVHERMAPQPTSPYGASKLMLEGYLSAFSSSYGVSGCALRFSNIYGPRSFHKGSVVAHFYKRILAGDHWSSTATAARPATSSTSATSSRRSGRPSTVTPRAPSSWGAGSRPPSTSSWTRCVP